MRIGFYDYDTATVGTDGVLFKSKFTSLPTYCTENGVGTHTYSAAGFTGEATAGINITGIPGQSTLLANEGTFQCRISKEALGASPGATETLFIGVGGTTTQLQKLTSGNVSIIAGSRLNHRVGGLDGYCDPELEACEEDMILMTITWDKAGIQVWWNYLLALDVAWNDSTTKSTFNDIRINANNTGGGTYTWTDVIISSSKVIFPTGTKGLNVINAYGDSYMQQSQYAAHLSDNLEKWSKVGPTDAGNDVDTLDGLTASVANGLGGYNRTDSSITLTLQRELAKRGLYTGIVRGWHIGGGGIEDANGAHTVRTRVTASLTGNYGPMPDVALIVAGYNDAIIVDQSTMQASWQAMIDELVAANSSIKIYVTTLPFNGNGGAYGPSIGEVQAYNAHINAINTANPEVTLIDIYTLWGGATNDNSNGFFGVDDIHPSLTGAMDYGKLIAKAIAEDLFFSVM